MAILEGKELEGKIGDVGQYSLDIDDKLMLKADVSISIDLIAEMQKAADKSGSDLLKKAVGALAGFLGRGQAEVPAAPQV